MRQIEDLLQRCTVKLSIPDQGVWGTGFFVAPGLILTCAHVVQKAQGQPLQVRWQNQENWAQAFVAQIQPDPYDLALLRVASPADTTPPCVYLEGEITSRDPLYLFGYPDRDFPNGCPVTFNCEGLTGDEPPLIKFALGQVRPGMSGSPLLNQRTGKVCGLVKLTRDRTSDLGGGAIPTRVILEQFPQLRQLQQQVHQQDARWVKRLAEMTAELSQTVHGDVVAGDKVGRDKIGTQITIQLADNSTADKPSSLADIDFEPYREAVICHYSQQRHLYTPTDALLPLEARSVARQAQDEPFPVLEGLRKYALGTKREHVLLVGRPGSGKSTTLRQLAVSLAEEGQVPVLVQLKGDRPVLEAISSELEKGDLYDLGPKEIKRLLRQQRFVLLLDGVNEIPNDPLRRSLIQFRQDHLTVPMIFTTRDFLGGALGIGKRLEMKPLSEPQMREFVGKYLPEQGDRLLGQLRDRLRELTETPLLLKLLCDVLDPETNEIPQNRGELFRQFDRDYKRIKKEIEYVPVSENFWEFKSEILQYLAFSMIQGEVQTTDHQKSPEPWLTIHIDRAEQILETWLHQRGVLNAPTKAKLWLKDLYKYHLLQDAEKPDEIEFHHQLFQEYYAAEYLLRLLQPLDGMPGLTNDQLKRDYLNYLRWTEPVALMLALVAEEAQALRVVKLAIDVDWMLAARLAGKVKPEFQAQTVKLVEELEAPDGLKVQLLGETRSEVALPELLVSLNHPNIDIAKVAASYIGETHNQTVIDVLTRRLEKISNQFFSQRSWGGPDKTGILWSTHMQALSYISPQTAIQFLHGKLQEHGTLLLMTTQAASILMQLDAESFIPELLKDFQNCQHEEKNNIAIDRKEPEVEIQMPELKNSGVCREADVTFNKFKSDRFTSPSSEWLKRNHILNLLENSSDYELFVPTLIQVLEQEIDDALQKQIVQILSASKHASAIHTLVQKIGEHNSTIRSEAAKQLIKLKSIDNPDSLEELHKLTGHEDWNISWCAAIVLGHLRDSSVVPRMMNELEKHQKPSIRSTAARVLGIIGDSNCVPSLLKTINSDSDRYVRINAACSLSYFAQKEAIPILLDSLEKPTYSHPYSEIIKSISRFGIKEPLLEIVRSKRNYWQRAAIELGNLVKSQGYGESEILPDLFEALVNLGHQSSDEIIDLLSELADSGTLNCLIEALEHPENHTQDIYFSDRISLVLVRCRPEIIADKLPVLRKLNNTNDIPQLSWLIPTIQNRCQFYDYEIFQPI